MAKKPSKNSQKSNKNSSKNRTKKPELKSNSKNSKKLSFKKSIKNFFARFKKSKSPFFHKSFKRSYREDYVRRETPTPGIMHHTITSFKIIFKNWKLFLPLLIVVVIFNIMFIGLMSESNYQQFQNVLDESSESIVGGDIGFVAKAGLTLISTVTTGGLSNESAEITTVFVVLSFLIIWLVTIFLLRHLLANKKVKLRDGLYNAMTPLISSFLVFIVAIIQCIPIFLLIIAYSAAVQTEFLATPFYALVFFIFAAAMILISGYLLSSSLIAFVAVSAPGLYPMQALRAASELMIGRRIKFVLRLIALIFIIAFTWFIVMMPLILFDFWMKTYEWTAGIPFIPICLNIMTCFTFIYVTTYLYLYYRWMLNYEEE